MAEQAIEGGRGRWESLRVWLFGTRGHDGKRITRGVLNQIAPASHAGDSPWLTSHGHGPSHAHAAEDDRDET